MIVRLCMVGMICVATLPSLATESERPFWEALPTGFAKVTATAEDAGDKPGKWSDLVEAELLSHLDVKAGGWVRYRVECVPDGEKVPILQLLRCGDVLHTKWRSSL